MNWFLKWRYSELSKPILYYNLVDFINVYLTSYKYIISNFYGNECVPWEWPKELRVPNLGFLVYKSRMEEGKGAWAAY